MCNALSSVEASRLNEQSVDRFQHQWIMDDDLTYSSNTGVNWLIYQEGWGMFCLLCRKHGTTNYQNKSKKYNVEPVGSNGKQLRIMPVLNNMQQLLQQSSSAEFQLLKKKWEKLKIVKMKFTIRHCSPCTGLQKRRSQTRNSWVFWHFFSSLVLKISSISNTVQLVQPEKCFFSLVAFWKHSW